jgi:subtilisin
MMKKILIAAFALLASVAVPAVTTSADAAEPTSSFIVVLQPGTANVPALASEMSASARGRLGFVYEHALQGFSITASDRAAAALARNPRVAYVERDQEVTLAAEPQVTPTGIDRISATGNAAIGIDGQDDRRVDVDVAVIDTGVDFQHPDLNVGPGINCASGSPFRAKCQTGQNAGDDDHYHGTHVAGTIGALDNGIGVVGVAPGARIHPVKVLNSQGSGYTSWIVAGIDWVANSANGIEVANMSLGGSGYSDAEYQAIQGAVDSGVAFAVAAGNNSDLASKYSPAAFGNVLTVSALADFDGKPGGDGAATCRVDNDDTLANFSNYGPAVDIAAPGVCIKSTYPIEQGEYGIISGTSMASPHAAGALALLASAAKPNNALDVMTLYQVVEDAGNLNWIDDSPDFNQQHLHEPLLDVSGFVPALISGGGGQTNQNPTVLITSPGDGDKFASGLPVTLAALTSDPDGDTVTVTWTENGNPVSANPFTPSLDGMYVIVATASDGKGGNATDTATITVGDPPPSTLVGSAVNNGRTWTATITYTGPTSVTGSWSVAPDTPAGCSVSSGASSCSFSSSGIAKKTASVTFTTTTGTVVQILKP